MSLRSSRLARSPGYVATWRFSDFAAAPLHVFNVFYWHTNLLVGRRSEMQIQHANNGARDPVTTVPCTLQPAPVWAPIRIRNQAGTHSELELFMQITFGLINLMGTGGALEAPLCISQVCFLFLTVISCWIYKLCAYARVVKWILSIQVFDFCFIFIFKPTTHRMEGYYRCVPIVN